MDMDGMMQARFEAYDDMMRAEWDERGQFPCDITVPPPPMRGRITVYISPAVQEPNSCPRCGGCGEQDAGGGRCVVCHGTGNDPGEPELPEGVWERGGQLFYECLSCERTFPLECDPAEFDPEVAYCGGSLRCLP